MVMVTIDPYSHRSQPNASAIGWPGIMAQDVTPGSSNSLTYLRDPLPGWRLPPEAPVVTHIDRLMEVLAGKVQFEDPYSIREYLLRFTDLLDVIPQAVAAAMKHFPEGQLVMDVYQDPEIDDQYLVLYVRLKNYDKFVERLEEAEAEFLDQLANKRGWVQLTTDFREPE